MMDIKKLREERAKCLEDADAIIKASEESDTEISAEQSAQIDSLIARADEIDEQVVAHEKAEERKAKVASRIESLSVAPRISPAGSSFAPVGDTIHATCNRVGHLKSFKGPDAEESAYRFGMFALAALGNKRAEQRCHDLAIHTEGSNSAGGYLVPNEFQPTLIRLVESYGVFRQYAKIIPMMRDTLSFPRRTGGLTAYFVGENVSGTESSMTFDRVNLTLKKIMALSMITNELSEDSAISIGDTLAMEVAQAFAYTEDNCGFNGDGSSTYGGITGLRSALTAATAGLSTAASGTATNWAGITMADFTEMIGLLPTYVQNPVWFASSGFYGSVMHDLAIDAGGNTKMDIQDGRPQLTFLGYPVARAQVLPKSASSAEIVCALGDMSMAASMGMGREMNIQFSDSAYVGSTSVFENDAIAVRGTERFDINVHDVGSTTEAGPVVGLLTAS